MKKIFADFANLQNSFKQALENLSQYNIFAQGKKKIKNNDINITIFLNFSFSKDCTFQF